MTAEPLTSPTVRARKFFLWAVYAVGGGFALAVLVRLVPSDLVHSAGIMFLPLLIPVAVVLAIISIVYASIALARRKRYPSTPIARILLPLIGSILLIVVIPALLLATQVVLVILGQLVG